MAFGEDWLGWIIFLFIVVSIIVIGIKILIEYPGITALKCVYNDEENTPENDSKIPSTTSIELYSDIELCTEKSIELKQEKSLKTNEVNKADSVICSEKMLGIEKEVTEVRNKNDKKKVSFITDAENHPSVLYNSYGCKEKSEVEGWKARLLLQNSGKGCISRSQS